MFSEKPFRHWILDNFIPPSMVSAALLEWPAPVWPYWHRYNDKTSKKYASKDILRLGPACLSIFNDICKLDICSLTGDPEIFPDFSGYGAGMHWIPEGGFLGMHLDTAKHPITEWRREYSACLYLTPESSGDLVLADNPEFTDSHRVSPKAGTLVVFECTDSSYHGVPEVVEYPGGRKSVAAFFWSTREVTATRTKADFK